MAGQLIFQPPTFHWPSKDQQTAFKEWQSHITLTLEASYIPWERWYTSIIGFLGSKRLQVMASSWDLQRHRRKKNTGKHLHHLRKYLRSLDMSQWNYIDEMYSDISAGRTRNHWPAWSMYQDLGQEMWLCINQKRRQDADWSYYFMRWNTLKLKSG